MHNINVTYYPTLWMQDGTDFYCEHASIDTETVISFAYNYAIEDIEEWEAERTYCRDCGEEVME